VPRWQARDPLGHGIARLPTRYYSPFLFTFPEQQIKNVTVPDAAVRERYTQWHKPAVQPALVSAPTSAPDARASLGAINEKERSLLLDIAAFPISTISERYDRLGFNPKTGTALKEDLLARGMIAVETVTTLR